MATQVYKVVKHDGGWAYQASGTFSERFPTHEAALKSARRAAQAQAAPNDASSIEYEDANGEWHQELVKAGDHPNTAVEGTDL